MTVKRIGTKTQAASVLMLAALLGLGVVASGQQAGQDVRGAQTATVDFLIISSKDGSPITDIKADEVTLRIDGKIRPIKTLQFVRAAGSGSSSGPAADIPPAFANNQTTASDMPRSIVLMIDDESMPIGQEIKIRSALTTFVTSLPATDQVALVTLPHGGIKVGFTADRERVRKEIANISPITPLQDPACQSLTTLGTLQSTLETLTRMSTQPVVVAYVSASLTGTSTVEAAQMPSAATGRGGLSAQGGACSIRNDDFARVGQAAAAARAQFYVIHPDYSQSPVREGIENLRGQTNAALYHLTSGAEPGLTRIARETSGYYIATFETQPDELVGKPHPSSVKTTRKDAEVRDRPYLVVGRATPAPSSLDRGTSTVTTAFELVRSGKQYRDLPLRATATPFRNTDGKINVVCWFEPLDPTVKIMTASAALIDENGRAMDFWPAPTEEPKMTSWPVAIGLTVAPGKYRLRIGAIDSNGRPGVIDDVVIAEAPKAGALQISGLALGVGDGTSFKPKLEFSKENEATAYFELYGATEGAQVGAYVEVAKTVNGPADQRIKTTFTAGPDGKFLVTAKIPLAGLAPGDYVIRGIAGEAGKPAARVIKTLHKIG